MKTKRCNQLSTMIKEAEDNMYTNKLPESKIRGFSHRDIGKKLSEKDHDKDHVKRAKNLKK